jgi:hypothetical protein
MSELDQDFESLVEQINAKLQEAADALKEANQLREKAGLPSMIPSQFILHNYRFENRDKSREEARQWFDEISKKIEKIDVSDLEDQLGEGGWSTSSSYC